MRVIMPGGLDLIAAYRPAPYNHLINGGMDVWQRGPGPFTVSSAYCADRWVVGVATSTVSVTRIASTIGSQGFSTQIAYTHVASGVGSYNQLIEGYKQLLGKTLTYSVTVKATVAGRIRPFLYDDVSGITYGPYNAGTGEERLTVTKTMSAGAVTNIQVGFDYGIGTFTVEINDATLVAGPYPAPYVPLTPEEDLSRCERYLERIGGDAAGFEPLGTGYNNTTTAARLHPVWRVEKAVTPSLSFSGSADFRILHSGGTTACNTTPGISVANVTKKSGIVEFTVAAGLTAGGGCGITSNSSSANFLIEANP